MRGTVHGLKACLQFRDQGRDVITATGRGIPGFEDFQPFRVAKAPVAQDIGR
jgi:hypothetical protein